MIRPYRHELKYYIGPQQDHLLAQRLALTMNRDENVGEDGTYHIRSLYFDDFADTALTTKLDGVEERKKYRIRIYNLRDNQVMLECKQKSGAFIQKRAVRITRAVAEALAAGNPDPLFGLGDPLAREVYIKMRTEQLHPVVVVDYTREPFVAPTQDVRVTFDRDIRAGVGLALFDPALPTVGAMQGQHAVLEVKFNAYLPAYYHTLLQTGTQLQSAISKYVLCRAFEAGTTYAV